MKKPAPAHGAKGSKTAKTAGHKPAHPAAKPAHVAPAVRQARHKAAVQAAKTRAKNAAKAKKHPRRQLALAEGVACCSAEALAASLRLTGWPVSDADVVALYWRTASDPDAGASILATLRAAQEFGLAGVRPERWRDLLDGSGEADHAVDHLPECAAGDGQPAHQPAPGHVVHAAQRSHLIVGVTLPGGRHAVTLDPSGAVWSWGELYQPTGPGLIEEAWLVDWEA